MKSFQLVGAVLSLAALVACSKSSLSTGQGPVADTKHVGAPVSPSASPIPMATPMDKSALTECSTDLLSEYKKVQQACKGIDDPFSDPSCYNAKESFDEKNSNTSCISHDGSTVICNRTDGSCAGLSALR